jgi:uncharacterized surface protein with fasciclin (FAS1) repeats
MKKIYAVIKGIVVCLIALSMFSCTENQVELGRSPNLNKINKSIFDYLKSNPSYSILVQALDTTKLSDVVNAYGSLTMFAPSNDAFIKYFGRKGISGLSKMNIDAIRMILEYHLYNQVFGSSLFLTGSLPAVTVSGDLIKMDISQGMKNIFLNNTVKIDSLDIAVTNGVVHVVNDVLEPPSGTIYSFLAGNPQYSIMAEAVKKTGVDTAVLNKITYDNSTIINGLPSKKWITAFFETNDVLHNAGINSFDDLAKKYSDSYSTTKNYTSITDSLNMFVRYHCMQRRFFIADITDDFMESISPGNWLIFGTKGSLNINKHDVNNIVFNPGTGQNDTIFTSTEVDITVSQSNQVLSNGIMHSINSVLYLYNPTPVTVKCPFLGTDEDQAITLLDGTVSTFPEQFVNLNNDPVGQSVVWWLKWGYTSGDFSVVKKQARNNPYIINTVYYPDDSQSRDGSLSGLQVANAVGLWIEVTTKPMFKGKYNLFLFEQNIHSGIVTQPWKFLWSIDGKQSPDMINTMSQFDAYGNDVRQWFPTGSGAFDAFYIWGNYAKMTIRKLGVFTFDQIQAHKVKFTMVDDNRAVSWFKLQFEPVQ